MNKVTISNSRRIVIPKAGHIIPREQPDLFNETVANFLTAREYLLLKTRIDGYVTVKKRIIVRAMHKRIRNNEK